MQSLIHLMCFASIKRLFGSGVWAVCGAFTLALVVISPRPALAETARELAAQYGREAMEQALQTKQRYDLYGIHFDVDKATIQPDTLSLLDDIEATLNQFPDWRLRIVGHTDATGDAVYNETLSLERANAIKAALVGRGIDATRLDTAGAGESQPVASNDTAEGQALNRRVELVRLGADAANAKRLVKAMSDYLAAQQAISFDYDAILEVITKEDQKIALASSGTIALNRPDKVHARRAGGFADVEMLFDGETLTVLGKNKNLYAQVAVPGTVDHLIDELRVKYDRPLPGADILLSNLYDEVMENVVDAKDLGSGVIGGVECDSLAFRSNEVDWQIWIAQGDHPYPCRYVITTKGMTGQPQYSIQIRNWKTGAEVAPSDFAFTNPTNAAKVDLKDLQDAAELPTNFMAGGAQ